LPAPRQPASGEGVRSRRLLARSTGSSKHQSIHERNANKK
jgi:hypothetical protein